MSDVVSTINRMLRGHTITERLSDGWYPSTHDPDTGAVRHDRHVLIHLRNYEAVMKAAAARITELEAENAQVRDYYDMGHEHGRLAERNRNE